MTTINGYPTLHPCDHRGYCPYDTIITDLGCYLNCNVGSDPYPDTIYRLHCETDNDCPFTNVTDMDTCFSQYQLGLCLSDQPKTHIKLLKEV